MRTREQLADELRRVVRDVTCDDNFDASAAPRHHLDFEIVPQSSKYRRGSHWALRYLFSSADVLDQQAITSALFAHDGCVGVLFVERLGSVTECHGARHRSG